MYNLNDKIALVTGSGRGIGRLTALRLAREGTDVVVVDLDLTNATQTAAEVTGLGRRSLAVRGDVSTRAGVDEIVAAAQAEFGRVDILVNNAGISRYKPILETTDQDWDQHVDIMAKGTFLLMRALAPGMIERQWGRIINLGSYVAQFNCVTKYFAPYCAAKFAIVGLTQVAAQEFAPYVTVNAVGPGDVATDMMEVEWQQEAELTGSTAADVKDRYRTRLLLQEFEGPEDIANAITWLCSEEAKHVTGAHQIVSGGLPFKNA